MDVDVLVANAHRRLRLRRLLVAIERNPRILEEVDMLKIKKPIELAGLKTRMIRAESHEKAIAKLGARYDAVQDRIEECIAAHAEHAGDLEQYEKDLREKIESQVGSNGGDPLPSDGDRDGQSGQPGAGQVISSETSK